MSDFLAVVLALPWSWQLWAALVATTIAGLMRGYAGFGTAIILAPVYSALWEPRNGVPVVLLMELVISLQLLPRAFKDADRRVILPIGGAACLATPIGTFVLLSADPDMLRRFIGGFVLVFGALMMSGWRYHGSRPLPLNLAVGTSAGLLKGATGMSGPPVILYLLSGPEEARQHRANLILFFGLIALVSVVGPYLGGLFTLDVLAKLVWILPVQILCVRLGARLFHVVPIRLYKPFALAVLLASGSFALLV
ncbi:sulfite exporter TauE/SafE family protein [Roseococcus sp.]|uniref:sulfite exporter TauE/SafE family protein n=1 Tax=Roseococcus sp. TaxID=2109646 RepID=UPI003BAAA61C